MVEGESLQFSHRLRRLREAAGLTQEALAERAGLSVKAISALERGRRQRPYPHTVRALADALGLSEHERAELAGAMPSRERAASAPHTPRLLLPAAPTPLIGREREVADVKALLRAGTARAITLTGAGGVGKSRLALEVASCLNDAFPGGVAFVPLAPLGDPRLVLPTVAQALGLTEAGTATVRERLAAYLGSHPWLLVLDNFEHVLDAAPEVAELLGVCPGLTILATSRASLRIRAEYEYPVRPLTLPDLSRVPTLDDVAHVSSVRLFLERAQAAVPAFDLTQANCAAVAAICRRLDGLPLALELVAARVRFLSPTELLARLDRLLPLLVGGSRDLPQRQQTMRAAINWSYEILRPAEQALFRRLSVFAGGWTLEAAEAVAAWGEVSLEEVIDLLSSLVEQSLVVAEVSPEGAGASRYRMLEPIRQFAADRVEEVGEKVKLFDHHLAWCLSLAQRAAPELVGPAQHHWLNRLEQEHDNLRVALAWSQRAEQRRTPGLQLATALWRFWGTRGHVTEGRRWLESALSVRDSVPTDLQAEGLNAAGNLACDQGDYAQSIVLQEASLTLRRELGDMDGVAKSLNDLGNVMLYQGEYAQALLLYEEALSLFRSLATDRGIALVLNNMGIVLGYRGEYERAATLLDEALVLWERLGDTARRARSLDALGVVARGQGDLTRAGELHEASLALRRALGDTPGIAVTLNNYGLVARDRGDYPAAECLIEESLRLRRMVGDKSGIAGSLSALAEVARDQGDTDRAKSLYKEAIAVQRQLGVKEGLANSLLGLAAIASDAGDLTRAARLLGASEALREATGQACAPVGRPEYERTVATIQERLHPAEHESVRAAGRAMTLDQAIADALDGYNGEGPGPWEDQRRTHLSGGVGLRGTLAGE